MRTDAHTAVVVAAAAVVVVAALAVLDPTVENEHQPQLL